MRKEYNFSKGKRGPVIQPDPNKVRITIRLDADIVDYFKEQVHKAGGGNYQTMIKPLNSTDVLPEAAPGALG